MKVALSSLKPGSFFRLRADPVGAEIYRVVRTGDKVSVYGLNGFRKSLSPDKQVYIGFPDRFIACFPFLAI
jgi:hypothetical protein